MKKRYWIYKGTKLVGGYELSPEEVQNLRSAGYRCVLTGDQL